LIPNHRFHQKKKKKEEEEEKKKKKTTTIKRCFQYSVTLGA
jgi:hypothetical protein